MRQEIFMLILIAIIVFGFFGSIAMMNHDNNICILNSRDAATAKSCATKG